MTHERRRAAEEGSVEARGRGLPRSTRTRSAKSSTTRLQDSVWNVEVASAEVGNPIHQYRIVLGPVS